MLLTGLSICCFRSGFQSQWTTGSGKAKHPGSDGLAKHETSVLAATEVSYTSRHAPNAPPETVIDPIKSEPAEKTTQGSPQRETLLPILHRKDYNKLPQWDFDDVYIQDAQPNQRVSRL